MSLVEIDCLGIGDRDRICGSRRRPGLSHGVRTRSGFRCIREAAALVDYTDRFASWSGRRIILSRVRHLTPANDWSWTLLVRHNSAGCFFAWPLVRRRCKYSNRVRGGHNPDGILFVASRSGGQHDRPRLRGFCCQRCAKTFFLNAADYKIATPPSAVAYETFNLVRSRRRRTVIPPLDAILESSVVRNR